MEYAVAASGSKKLRAGRHSEMESATDHRTSSLPMLCCEKKPKFGSDLDMADFQYSNGWLQRF